MGLKFCFHLLVLSSIFLIFLFFLTLYKHQDLFQNPSIRSNRIHEENNRSTSSNSSSTSPLVPALFVVGDSTVDCGSNKYLLSWSQPQSVRDFTIASANHPPYGRDFDTHRPTGRFCNGRIPVDYLALRLGLPFVPSFLGLSGQVEEILHGVNYASAGAGILSSTGSEMGVHASLTQQIDQFKENFQQIKLHLGVEAANDMISKSIFYISIGSNDIIHSSAPNASRVQNLWGFNGPLTKSIKQEVKNLYNVNIRKMVVMGLPPLGCAPFYLWHSKSKIGECDGEINIMIAEFSYAMQFIVYELNRELLDLKITFCDTLEAYEDILATYEQYGFETITDACCGRGKYGGSIRCQFPSMACRNASSHVWWDQFHPTDAVNAILADTVWSGLYDNMCYPINMKDMVP